VTIENENEPSDLHRCGIAFRRLQQAQYQVNEACAQICCVGFGDRMAGELAELSNKIAEAYRGIESLANRIQEREAAHA